MPRKIRRPPVQTGPDLSALAPSLAQTSPPTRGIVRWNREGQTLTHLFDLYGVARNRWQRDQAAGLGGIVQWLDWDGEMQHLLMPENDASEPEWQAFFVLLEMRLKFMPRAA